MFDILYWSLIGSGASSTSTSTGNGNGTGTVNDEQDC